MVTLFFILDTPDAAIATNYSARHQTMQKIDQKYFCFCKNKMHKITMYIQVNFKAVIILSAYYLIYIRPTGKLLPCSEELRLLTLIFHFLCLQMWFTLNILLNFCLKNLEITGTCTMIECWIIELYIYLFDKLSYTGHWMTCNFKITLLAYE